MYLPVIHTHLQSYCNEYIMLINIYRGNDFI
nr:MAG TPA: hypothetical protein [Crassvirales sp.]